MTLQPIRRIVTVDDELGRGTAIQDGPVQAARTDPARPGFATTHIWTTDSTPPAVPGDFGVVHQPDTLEPPPRGSVCRVITVPPDATWQGRVGAAEVGAYFAAMGSPAASRYSPSAPHPYMQRTRTLDFCLILEGEVTLVLDAEEVHLQAGDTVVQRGSNHAWSNRSNAPCIIAISSHDGTYA